MYHQDRIFIVGAGAIGKALAVFLKKEGKKVVIIRGSINNQETYSEEIKVQINGGKVLSEKIEITTLSSHSSLDGLVVLTSKSFANTQLAQKLKSKISQSPLVILQNGLNVEDPFLDNGFLQIYRCVVLATSQYLTTAIWRFRAITASPVGIITGEKEILKYIVGQLNNSYFEFQIEPNIHPAIWTKAVVNCVFNSICPLIEVDNGVFYRNKAIQTIAERLIKDCLVIAEASGVVLNFKEVMNRLLLISELSEGQMISTYQDIKKHKQTEIESLNFAFVKYAGRFGLSQRTTEIKLLGELIRLKSQLTR